MSSAWADGVLEDLFRQILSDPPLTSAGVFVGTDSGGALQINGTITTLSDAPTGAIPLDEERWSWIHQALDAYYEDHGLVGWYVARPGVGAVPTEIDAALHTEFFGSPQHILLCADPRSGEIAAYTTDDADNLMRFGRGDIRTLLGFGPSRMDRRKNRRRR